MTGFCVATRFRSFVVAALLLASLLCPVTSQSATDSQSVAEIQAAGISLERFKPRELAVFKAIIAKLEPLIETRTRLGTQSTISFDELYRPLNREESAYLKALQDIKPEQLGLKTPYLGYGNGSSGLVRLEQTYVDMAGVKIVIPPQYMPEQVRSGYETMMSAMQKEIGKRLHVISAYRSGAYQLYTFLAYLPGNNWSVRQTSRFVAFPGYSEHGDSSRQALDFMSSDKTSEQAGQFEKTAEYAWLMERARCFGFVLSYPPNSPTGITFEPWHWHFEEGLNCRSEN